MGKKILMLLIIAFFSIFPNLVEGKGKYINTTNYSEAREELSKKTVSYYKKAGWTRDEDRFHYFLQSAANVAEMFPMYPAKNKFDRMLKMYCYGGQESIYRLCFININVPGATYINGKLHVRNYSLDYDWVGLNDMNVIWTKKVAEDIQNQRPISKKYATQKLINILKGAYIPKTIKLKEINTKISHNIKAEWRRLDKAGYHPNNILQQLNKIPTGYMSYTQNDLDSLLIYRIIVELDRITRGWDYETYDKELYNYLKKN